jgi:hypothetical protein
MSNTSRSSSRTDHVLSVLGVVCVLVCVIAGLAVVGYVVLVGMAMSKYGSNK